MQEEYMVALKAATEAAFANAAWMSTTGNKDINRIDAWIGGLAEREVAGGMLGSTFDAVFAIQMMNLQNGDFFYYLGRVPNTEFFVEGMEGNQYSDLVMRNSSATDIYGDIFSVADSYEKVGDTAGNASAATLADLAAITTTKQVFDLAGNVIQADIGTAGFVGTVFTGNQGNYVDARNVLNANGIGNAGEMISGTALADRIDGLGGNDTIRAGAGDDIINGGSGVDYLYGDAGNDTINGDSENDFIYSGDGNDTVRGGLGIDVIFGHAGDDTIFGGADADVIVGGSCNDTIYGGDGIAVAVALVDPLHPDVLIALDPEPAVAVAVLMPVVPQFSLVQQKEKDQAQQQGHEQGVGSGFTFKGLGQEVQKRCGQQGPCGQTEHVLGVAAEHTKTQPGSQPNAANACCQGTHQNRQ
jgi:Ca2+-binding RTX toxin-like protein